MAVDTIAAVATAVGRAGVSVVRISGPDTLAISECITKKKLRPRYAEHCFFYSENTEIIDEGIALLFVGPHSFTGEDVLELQGHGGHISPQRLLKAAIDAGARLANPGEFSERAFINGKIDLVQAEAIADLVAASSEQAARSALQSLQGEFSKAVNTIIDALTALRVYVEASIDFPEEEIDFLTQGQVQNKTTDLLHSLNDLITQAEQGVLLQEGFKLVLAGSPNAGKSSLMNRLLGQERAIVTDLPGTTRDLLHEQLHLGGLPLHIIDTAGLRETDDSIEQEGIKRAWKAVEQADMILYLKDISADPLDDPWLEKLKALNKPWLLVWNKIDLLETPNRWVEKSNTEQAYLSAKTGLGMETFKKIIQEQAGYQETGQSVFLARRRHLDALAEALRHLQEAGDQFKSTPAGELIAEHLRCAHQSLGEITGKVTADELLGKIFSSFCIGK